MINYDELPRIPIDFYDNNITITEIIKDQAATILPDRPFYIIDLGQLIVSYEKWKTYLPTVKPYYAVKCNTNPIILETLANLGANFDCASEKEISTILRITENDPDRIIFANPCKIPSHIEYAKSKFVDRMTFDCAEELYKIKKIHPSAKLFLRLAVDDSKSICKFNKKFGCTIEEMDLLFVLAKDLGLNIVGICFHVGSGCKSSEVFYSALETVNVAVYIAKQYDIDIKVIDIGGGFPGIDTEMVQFKDIAENINKGICKFFSDKNIEFIAEPGRFFAQPTHTLVVQVIGKKAKRNVNGDRRFEYTLNEGVYHSFNCTIFDHYSPILAPLRKTGPNDEIFPSKVFGQTCDSMDTICEECMLPELNIGDYIYVENFGAYTISASSGFNGFEPTLLSKYIVRGKHPAVRPVFVNLE